MRSENAQPRQYFAAANSQNGFVNYFPQIFDMGRCRRLFVILGGPGTGKSSFMRYVGSRAEQRDYEVIYYACSSDADSLDGLFIPALSVGFVDGTAPHVWHPRAVGIVEQWINLGAFWDEDLLAERREKIEKLNREKGASYRRAYSYLSAVGSVRKALEEKICAILDAEKMTRAAERIVSRYAPEREAHPAVEIGLCDSIGMGGRVRFDTYERAYGHHFVVEDFGDTAHFLFAELYALLQRRGVSVRVSYDPILCHRINALEILENGVTVSLAARDSEDTVIRMRRFVDTEAFREIRSLYRETQAVEEELLALSEGAFSEIRRVHFELERLFGETMDFSGKERFGKTFCKQLFDRTT